MSKTVSWSLVLLTASACKGAPPEPTPAEKPTEPASTAKATPAVTAAAAPTAPRVRPPASVRVSPDDPLQGAFTLADAVAGLPGEGKLVAELKTDLGVLECELYEDKAPITVANFVGLARGLRDWKDPSGTWVKKPAYDGTGFHRVIKGFMIQGGDASGTGAGSPGYVIPDEIWPGAAHDKRGLICMANRGPNTNGAQFFITDAAAPHLDRGYTIFGQCGPDAVIEKLASVEVRGDQSVKPSKIQTVTVKRK